MDQDPNRPAPRQVKFKPKLRRKPPTTAPTAQIASSSTADGDDADADDKETPNSLLDRKLNDHLARRQPKYAEKKPPAQVAFQAGGGSSGALMTFGKRKEAKTEGSPLLDGGEKPNSVGSQRSRAHKPILSDGTDEIMEDLSEETTSTDDDDEKKKKYYREPWDYDSNYPTTLPWRKPYSGDPELLDREEFGGEAKYDEKATNPASELGLLEEDGKSKLLLFQVPPLPLRKASSSKGKEIATTSSSAVATKGKEISGDLKDLPGGRIGKMLVYRSGAVKMKIGDVLFDVSPGVEVSCPQDVVAVDTKTRSCVKSGEIEKWAVVAPDVDSLLEDC